MNPTLLRLVVLESRAMALRALRRLPTKTGVLVCLALALVALALPYSAYLSLELGGGIEAKLNRFRSAAPLVFFALVLLGAVSPRGLFFRPAEIALLFPSPLPRRELVLYNVLWRSRLALLSGAWFTIFAIWAGRPPLVSFIGYTLALVFLQVSSQWLAVCRNYLGACPNLFRFVLVTVGSLFTGSLLFGKTGELIGVLSWTTRAPLEVIASPTMVTALPWVVVSLLSIAALVWGITRLDAVYEEAAFSRTAARRSLRVRIARGGGWLGPVRLGASVRLPKPPRLGGAGPLAWRQCLELVRNPRGVILMTVMMAATAALAVAVTDSDKMNSSWAAIALICIVPLISSDSMPFDFRRDLDRMATLKSLPISRTALSVGQILPATLFVTTVQWLGIAVVSIVSGAVSLKAFAAIATLLPPINWCAIALENALFLLAPYRTAPDDPGDMTFAGRLALGMTLKLGALLLLAGLGLVVALSAFFVSKGSFVAMAFGLAVTFTLACIPATRTTGWAFGRFDIARDVPV